MLSLNGTFSLYRKPVIGEYGLTIGHVYIQGIVVAQEGNGVLFSAVSEEGDLAVPIWLSGVDVVQLDCMPGSLAHQFQEMRWGYYSPTKALESGAIVYLTPLGEGKICTHTGTDPIEAQNPTRYPDAMMVGRVLGQAIGKLGDVKTVYSPQECVDLNAKIVEARKKDEAEAAAKEAAKNKPNLRSADMLLASILASSAMGLGGMGSLFGGLPSLEELPYDPVINPDGRKSNPSPTHCDGDCEHCQ